MTTSGWERIDGFRTLGEFDRFEAWMMDLVSKGKVRQVPVTQPYLGATTFTEAWFQHVGAGEVWRLVWPDGPFTGLFDRVR